MINNVYPYIPCLKCVFEGVHCTHLMSWSWQVCLFSLIWILFDVKICGSLKQIELLLIKFRSFLSVLLKQTHVSHYKLIFIMNSLFWNALLIHFYFIFYFFFWWEWELGLFNTGDSNWGNSETDEFNKQILVFLHMTQVLLKFTCKLYLIWYN